MFKLTVPVFSHVANRTLPAGTPVEILARRGNEVLVKAKGASWPISLTEDKITKGQI